MKRRFLTKRLESKCLQCGEFWHDQCSAQQGGTAGPGATDGRSCDVTHGTTSKVQSGDIGVYTLCIDNFALMMMMILSDSV